MSRRNDMRPGALASCASDRARALGESGCRAGSPAVEAHGCAAFALAVGPAPARLNGAPRAIRGNPLLACPDGQVLPRAKEADDTRTQQGEGMNAIPTDQQFRIMHIM